MEFYSIFKILAFKIGKLGFEIPARFQKGCARFQRVADSSVQVELHDPWFLEVAQHQLVLLKHAKPTQTLEF